LINVGLLAPLWMLFDTAMADFLWISLIFDVAAGLAVGVAARRNAGGAKAVSNGARRNDKFTSRLTKAALISAVAITTLAAMFIRGQRLAGIRSLTVGGFLIATWPGSMRRQGSSNAIIHVVASADLDVRMSAPRACLRHGDSINSFRARRFEFGFRLEIFSFGLLWLSSNLFAATMALAGSVSMLIVYTLLLQTPHMEQYRDWWPRRALFSFVGYALPQVSSVLLAWKLFALIIRVDAGYFALAI
jgi:protoheme IX farnesyltransferase